MENDSDVYDDIFLLNITRKNRTDFDNKCTAVGGSPPDMGWMQLSVATFGPWITKIGTLAGEDRIREILHMYDHCFGLQFKWKKLFVEANETWASSDEFMRSFLRKRLYICQHFIWELFGVFAQLCELMLPECRRFNLDTNSVLRMQQEYLLCRTNSLIGEDLPYGTPIEESSKIYHEALKPYLHNGLMPFPAFRETIAVLRGRIHTKADEFSSAFPAKEIPPLNETARMAADYITTHPGSTGKHIADKISVSFEHFRRSIVPALKKHGFTNRKGGEGYYPPQKQA